MQYGENHRIINHMHLKGMFVFPHFLNSWESVPSKSWILKHEWNRCTLYFFAAVEGACIFQKRTQTMHSSEIHVNIKHVLFHYEVQVITKYMYWSNFEIHVFFKL